MRTRRMTAWALGSALAMTTLLGAMPAEAAPPGVTMRFATGARSEAGDPVVVKGTATKVPTGTTVTLEQRVDDAWKPVSQSTTRSTGAYRIAFDSSGVGEQRFRAKVAAAGAQPARSSESRVLTVAAWFRLDEQPMLRKTDRVTVGKVFSGDRKSDHAVSMDPGDGPAADPVLRSASWLLDGSCSLLTARAAWAAKGYPGSDSVRVLVDGDVVLKGDIASGAAVDVEQTVRGADVLKLTAAARTGGPAGSKMIWFDPRVLCTADPWND